MSRSYTTWLVESRRKKKAFYNWLLICNSFLFSAKEGIHLPRQPYLPTRRLFSLRESPSLPPEQGFHSESLPLTVTLTHLKCEHTNEIVKNNWATCVEKKKKETKKRERERKVTLLGCAHSHAKYFASKRRNVCTNVSQDYFCLLFSFSPALLQQFLRCRWFVSPNPYL